MYLFSRNRTAHPDKMLEATAYAIEITEKVNSISGLGLRVWSAVYGAPLGTIAWTATVASQAEMGAASEKVLADSSYQDALQGGQGLFEGPVEDQLVDMIALAGDGGHGGDYATLVQAQTASGRAVEAMTFGVEILNHVSGLTGRDGVFGRSVYGPWGGIGWITMAASLDEVDAATAAIAADTTYITKVDAAGPLFIPGGSSTRLTRRIG